MAQPLTINYHNNVYNDNIIAYKNDGNINCKGNNNNNISNPLKSNVYVIMIIKNHENMKIPKIIRYNYIY